MDRIFSCLVFILVSFKPNCQASLLQYSTAVVHNPAHAVDFVRLAQPPLRLHHNFPLHVEYFCTRPSFIHVELWISTESQNDWAVYRSYLNCTVNEVRQQVVRIRLPRYVAFRPSRHNRYSVYLEKRATIEVWMSQGLSSRPLRKRRVEKAGVVVASDEAVIEVVEPFERPERPTDKCHDWMEMVLARFPWKPQCPYELEVFPLVEFPVALNGARTGVHRVVPEYKSRVLQSLRRLNRNILECTFVFWLYIEDYCPTASLCSLLHHITWDDRMATPLFYINKNGQLHLELILDSGITTAFLTSLDFSIPKFQWVRLMISTHPTQPWNLYLNYGPKFELKAIAQIILENLRPSYDDVFGIFILGGSEIFPTFKGYLGQAAIHRRKSLLPQQLSVPSSSHPMFALELDDRRRRCLRYVHYVNSVIFQSKVLLDEIIRRKSCPYKNLDVLQMTSSYTPSSSSSICHPFNVPRSRGDALLRRLVRRSVMEGNDVSLTEIGTELHQNATAFLDEDSAKADFSDMRAVIGRLKEASCLGNSEASFLLSTLLYYGLAVPINESLGRLYLMAAAVEGSHRLSLLSMANKHVFGLDGFPADLEFAYVYYKTVADLTRADLEQHSNTGALTELVRLTNEVHISSQTEETGDLFIWLKHQASQGVLHAQQSIARMFYWGAQGIKRNLAAAAEYYRISASSGDPVALYDYGIIQLKGHGTKRNLTGAVKSLEEAAKHQHPDALNTLGWHALEIEKNHSKAADFFQRSYALGSKDAAFNLAHMYLQGIFPGSGINRDKAFDFILSAATKGQLEAGILLAMYIIRGHPRVVREPHVAMEWARYIAEQNPSVGKVLSSGVRAFRKRHWQRSLVFYLMAASSGVEVANFNLAYLCDENYGNVKSLVEKDCKWRHFNLSTQRPFKDVNSYAWIKMAEYYYYGSMASVWDIEKVATMYSNAALAGDPQGIFSLACLVEEGMKISDEIWKKLHIQHQVYKDREKLLILLFTRCRESAGGEAYIPCTIALYRVQSLFFYARYQILILTFLVILFSTISFGVAVRLCNCFQSTRITGGEV